MSHAICYSYGADNNTPSEYKFENFPVTGRFSTKRKKIFFFNFLRLQAAIIPQ